MRTVALLLLLAGCDQPTPQSHPEDAWITQNCKIEKQDLHDCKHYYWVCTGDVHLTTSDCR